jgi:hypothetical protein
MEQKALLKRVVDFHKASFDNSYDTMTMVQSQSEKIVESLWDQSHRSTKDAQGAFSQWAAVCRKSREDFKRAVDNGYEKLIALFGEDSGLEPLKAKKQEKMASEKKEPQKQEKTKEK